MTRILDFWFGVWDPILREEYRRVYKYSPKFARLPPTNKGHPETYCLRVVVCNRSTDEHDDAYDWRRGLTGLVQLGEFEGWALCFNQLGLCLEGYQAGAVVLFRGHELKHYIGPWTGKDRYAFDHTTHESFRKAVEKEMREAQVKAEADNAWLNVCGYEIGWQ